MSLRGKGSPASEPHKMALQRSHSLLTCCNDGLAVSQKPTSVLLISRRTMLSKAHFPCYKTLATRGKHVTTGAAFAHGTKVKILYISHAWARGRNGTDAVPHGPDDPGKQQYRAVERFLRTPLGKTFTHIYLDCACIPPAGDKGRAAALANSATALIIASDLLLVPQTVVLSDGRACTDLRECLTRAKPLTEVAAAQLLGLDIHVLSRVGKSAVVLPLQLPSKQLPSDKAPLAVLADTALAKVCPSQKQCKEDIRFKFSVPQLSPAAAAAAATAAVAVFWSKDKLLRRSRLLGSRNSSKRYTSYRRSRTTSGCSSSGISTTSSSYRSDGFSSGVSDASRSSRVSTASTVARFRRAISSYSSTTSRNVSFSHTTGSSTT
eukprot:3452-Heterococcus_DN1.PRE.2